MSDASPSMGVRFALALFRAGLVIAAALVCASLLPATYETSAIVRSNTALPAEPEVLLESALDGPTLQRLSRERSGAFALATGSAQAAGELLTSLRVDRVDAATLSVSLRDSNAERAQRHANELAETLVQRAPTVFDRARTTARQKAARDVLDFLAAQPGLWREPAQEPSAADETRRRVSNLLTERAMVEQRIAEAASQAPEENSDNPYNLGTPPGPSLDQLNRRLVEIDMTLARERGSLSQTTSAAAGATASHLAHLKALLARVDAPAGPTLRPVFSVVRPAPKPSWPMQSMQTLVLVFGGLAAVGVFLLPELFRSAPEIAPASDPIPAERVSYAPRNSAALAARESGAPPALAHGRPPGWPPAESLVVPDEPAYPPTEPKLVAVAPITSAASGAPNPQLASPSPPPAAVARAGSASGLTSSAPPGAVGREATGQPSSQADESVVMAYPAERWTPPATSERCRNLCRELAELAQGTSLVVTVSSASALSELRGRMALELALGLSELPEARVLLLEADFGKPARSPLVNAGTLAAKPFWEQLQSKLAGSNEPRWFVTACNPSLHALLGASGGTPDLITSVPFKHCVTELQEYYDFLVIAGPSLDRVKECRAADAVSDTIVVVHGENQPLDPRGWPFAKRLMLLSVRA